VRELLAPESPEEASARADGYRRETGPERSRTAGRTVRWLERVKKCILRIGG